MSQLIARILLAIFVIPVSGLVYLVTVVQSERWLRSWLSYNSSYYDGEQMVFAFTGVVAWIFAAAWWILLWRKSVRWNDRRIVLTIALVIAAALAGVLIAAILDQSQRGMGDFVGSAAAPLLWIIGTIFVWRETAAERAQRITSSGRDAIVCPTCGYNLTGLKDSRCPECGTQFTLDELLAAQPTRVQAEIEG